MSSDHGSQLGLFDRVHNFAVAGANNELTEDRWSDFEQLLQENDDALRLYIQYMVQSDFLRAVMDAIQDEDSPSPDIFSLEPSDSAFPAPTFPVTLWHGAIGYFSSDWSLSYLIATVVCGVAALIGSLIYVSRYEQVVENPPSRAVERQLTTLSKVESVGKITGMVDCKWTKGSDPLVGNDAVSLGREFKIESGLVEIGYNTGAKVILQGPVSYLVESKNGGFMSVGKLTGKVTTAGAKGFSVRTPTAIVTDLGTEFGVEVSKLELTQVHVLEGIVEARGIGRQGSPERYERLTEGKAVEIGPQGEKIKAVAFAPQSFMRKLQRVIDTPVEAAYISTVLADKPMGYWPLNEPANSRKFHDRSGNGFHGYAMQKVLAGQPGPMSKTRAIELDGNGYIDLGCHPEFAMKNDLTFEAWVLIGKVRRHGIVFSIHQEDHPYPNGWGLGAGRGIAGDGSENAPTLFLDSYMIKRFDFPLSSSEVIEGRWLHVAAVYDRADTAHLYLDGEHRGSVAGGKPVDLGKVWLAIGCAESTEQPDTSDGIDASRWRGRISHVAVYPRALTAQQIQAHYSQQNKAPDTVSPASRKETP